MRGKENKEANEKVLQNIVIIFLTFVFLFLYIKMLFF